MTFAAKVLADARGADEWGEGRGWSGRKLRAEAAVIMARHSEGERMEVRRRADGTEGWGCADADVFGGVQASGPGIARDGEVVSARRMALGDEA